MDMVEVCTEEQIQTYCSFQIYVNQQEVASFCAVGPSPGGSTEINGPKLPGMGGIQLHSAKDPAGVAQGTLNIIFLCFE